MKLFRTSGLVVFLLSFAIFNLSFFAENYELTEETISTTVPSNQAAEVIIQSKESFGKSFSSNFAFVSELDRIFENTNQAALSNYGINSEERGQLATLYQELIELEKLPQVFDTTTEIGRFKAKTFYDYGSWLEGRTPTSNEELVGWIDIVSNNISTYGILGSYGLDRYQIKDLKYRLTKASSVGPVSNNPVLFLIICFVGCMVGAAFYILPSLYTEHPGIKNNGIFKGAMRNRGWLGILTGTYLILFYIVLYYFHEYMTTWILMVDPVSQFLSGNPAGQFFLYGFMYTLVIIVMGIRMMIKYRHSKYQLIRTVSVIFFQTAFAFLIPEILVKLNQPYYDFKNIWPLDYDFFFDNELSNLIQSGGLGIFMLVWGIMLVVIIVPVMVYFFGKRWYCSWVCGCGGLAETLGDPYRQLSDKSLKSWKVERYLIHGILLFAVVMTAGVLYTYFTGNGTVLGINSYSLRETYGAWIGAGFAGVVGTGFYPLMGNRVWCRFGCPLAAYLGFVQRFKSRFRITTNGGQCISCGNCSTYCEMGIDVRWYAQRGQNIVRSSCVGCGICSAVCPRGVLNLENKAEKGRFGKAELLG